MATTERECIEALREAAHRLGKSPPKAEYEELDVLPSSMPILRYFDGWNVAKQAADLESFAQGENGGRDVEPKPSGVDLPENRDWGALTAQQRWYYKNRQHRIETKEARRRALHQWLSEFKQQNVSCRRCDEQRPPAIDFHHPGQKEQSISEMVNDGYARERIRDEIDQCVPLCANCHRREHADEDSAGGDGTSAEIERKTKAASGHEAREYRRLWLEAYKRESGGCARCGEDSIACLDFHHVGEKRMGVGRMVAFGHPLAEIQRELEACELLCANCHRVTHFEPSSPDCDDTHK